MESITIGSAQIKNATAHEKGYIQVRIFGKEIGLCLSLEHDGDVEMFLDTDQCKQVIGWLNEAVKRVGE